LPSGIGRIVPRPVAIDIATLDRRAPLVAGPSEDEVVSYLDRLDNAGRWGADDVLGTLNLITPEIRLAALAGVRDGLTISCSRPIVAEPGASDVVDPPTDEFVTTTPMTTSEPRIGTVSDRLGLPAHGVTITHVDALTHFSVDGRSYGGRATATATADAAIPAAASSTPDASVAAMAEGILTRGVLVDVAASRGVAWLDAGDTIEEADLAAWETAHDVRIGSGDALLIRTGWPRRRREAGPHPERKHRPGLGAGVLPWLHERGVAIVASDAAHDAVPSGLTRIPMPIHTIGLVAMGLCLIDNADFDALAAASAERDRWTCLFVVAALRWPGASGSPVNPIAVL
jgi:kynurenine formamidase